MPPAEQQARLTAALRAIAVETDPVKVRTTTAYVFGYIDAHVDAGLLTLDVARYLRETATERHDKRLADLGAEPATATI